MLPSYDLDKSLDDRRGSDTISVIQLDREHFQFRRQNAMRCLVEFTEKLIERILTSKLTIDGAPAEINRIYHQINNPGIAAYFLYGPGQKLEPFNELFALISMQRIP